MAENNSSAPLLPCPFCGAAARMKPSTRGDYTSIVCNSPCAGPLAIVVPNDQIEAGIAAWNTRAPQAQPAFQQRVQPWMMECFGAEHAADRKKRNQHFLEEALELVQSTGWTQSEAHQLVDYVYDRPAGDPAQEVGGVMVTLAALCLANGLDMHGCGDSELARIWTNVDNIRARQAAKPSFSPLPQAQPADALDASRFAWLAKSSWYVGPSSFYADEAGALQDYDDMNLSPEELRASIDAAMAAAQEGGNAANLKRS